MTEMSTEELKTLIRDTVEQTVDYKMKEHACRFTENEAHRMHEAAREFSADDLRRVAKIANAVDADHEGAVYMALKIICRTYDGVVRWVSIGILAGFVFIIVLLVKIFIIRGG